MMLYDNKEYIRKVEATEIPWHRLTTIYKRATDFPKCFDVLRKMEDIDEIKRTVKEIAINIEHQSTLAHATPFTLIFLLRIFEYAIGVREKNVASGTVIELLLELFIVLAEVISEARELDQPEHLSHFSDMLREEYLWSEEYDEYEDSLRYEEDGVFPDVLFCSFYYYSDQVLLLCKPLLIGLNDKRAKILDALL